MEKTPNSSQMYTSFLKMGKVEVSPLTKRKKPIEKMMLINNIINTRLQRKLFIEQRKNSEKNDDLELSRTEENSPYVRQMKKLPQVLEKADERDPA